MAISFLDFEQPIAELEAKIEELRHVKAGDGANIQAEIARLEMLPWTRLDDVFAATVQSVEEAVANALFANEEMNGRLGRRVPGLPRERVAGLLRAAGRIRD